MLKEAALIVSQMPLMSGLPAAVRLATTGFGADCACAAAPVARAQHAASRATSRRVAPTGARIEAAWNGPRIEQALCAKTSSEIRDSGQYAEPTAATQRRASRPGGGSRTLTGHVRNP